MQFGIFLVTRSYTVGLSYFVDCIYRSSPNWLIVVFVHVGFVLRQQNWQVVLLYPAFGILESWVMGLYDSRNWPGFQHTLAESWEVLLLATLWGNYLCVGKRGKHDGELLLCVPLKDNHQGFTDQGVNEI